MSQIELKVGQKWMNRKGILVTISRQTDDVPYCFHSTCGTSYSETGRYSMDIVNHYRDLVELVKDAPTDPLVEGEVLAAGVHAQFNLLTTQVGGQHYKATGLQPWDVIDKWFTPEQKMGYFWGETLAYLGRLNVKGIVNKGGLQDALKAKHTLEKLIEVLQAEENK